MPALIREFVTDFGNMQGCAALYVLLAAFTYTETMFDRENYLDAARRVLMPYLPNSDKFLSRITKHMLFWLRRDKAQKGTVTFRV